MFFRRHKMKQNDDTLSLYLKDINRMPLLTREEEVELATRAKNGDKIAKDKIINANLRFVVSVAKKYQNQGTDLIDLISEGNIGLITAIEKFDVSKGYHFISYAVWWIRQSILKAICEKSRAIRLPLNRANELVQIEKTRKTITGNKTDEEEIKEIAEILHMSETHVRDILNIAQDMISLDATTGNSESNTMGDFIEDSRYESPENSIIELSLQEDIESILSKMNEKEANVIRYRYGLNGKESMSLKEVGSVLNLTKERIRQIEKNALLHMQHPQYAERLEAYVA